MAVAYIGLGSNLGSREHNIFEAIEQLSDTKGIEVRKRSYLYETEPVGGPTQRKYLNSVIEIECVLKPGELLMLLHKIENKLGRQREGENFPRTIDLDVLLYDELILDEPDLIVPHPRMLERQFVLEPLAEIAPQLKHPLSGRTMSEHLREISVDETGEKS